VRTPLAPCKDFDRSRRSEATRRFCAWASPETDTGPSPAGAERYRATSARTPTSSDRSRSWEDCREELSSGTWRSPPGEGAVERWGGFATDRPGPLPAATSRRRPWPTRSSSCWRPLGNCWRSSLEIPEISSRSRQTSDRTFRIWVEARLGLGGGKANCWAFRVDRRPRTSDCKDV